jgi:gas vesicle protein
MAKWTTFGVLIGGAMLGAVAATLLAPKSGEEIREDLTDRMNEGVRRAKTAGKSVARRAQELADQAQNSVSDVADAGIRAARRETHS